MPKWRTWINNAKVENGVYPCPSKNGVKYFQNVKGVKQCQSGEWG